MLERTYQGRLIKKLDRMFPGCVILKNDSGYQQGIPDLVIFYGNQYAMLEVKPRQPRGPEDYEPNQEYFIALFDQMSFGACIYPENERDVLHDLQQAFGARRPALVSQRK